MISLLAAGIFFVGIHIFVSGTPLRGRLVGVMGERPYQGMFALLSLIGIVWLIWAYGETDGALVWELPAAVRHLSMLLTVFAGLLVVIGLTTPMPTTMGSENLLRSESPARGIVRVTRHPFLCGVALWAFAHLLVNGDSASIILFGTFLVLACVGPFLIDRKRALAFGDQWQAFAEATSSVPFWAIIQKRNRLIVSEISFLRPLAAGLAIGAII